MEIFILVAWVATEVRDSSWQQSSLVHIGEFSSQDACTRAANVLKSYGSTGRPPVIDTWCLPKQ